MNYRKSQHHESHSTTLTIELVLSNIVDRLYKDI